MDALRCVGACAIAPVVLVGEKVYQKVKPGDVAKKFLAEILEMKRLYLKIAVKDGGKFYVTNNF